MNSPEKTTDIDTQPLEKLARQVAFWAQELIASGRSPFRRVEPFAPLLTDAGELLPPLVFWINRDSFMAGGAVFFPERDADAPLAQGELCAAALGLNYYVAWQKHDIALWQRQAHGWTQIKKLPVGTGRQPGPAEFHEALIRLMEEMKTFSVLGAVPPDELSPWYLANLLRCTLFSLLPPLTEHYRVHRALGQGVPSEFCAERQALGKAMLTLARSMALALHDRLPGSTPPQTLEKVIDTALAALPPDLSEVLRIPSGETPLPEETLVRLHLLMHRLTQLGIARRRADAVQALEILQRHTAADLGGHPLPVDRRLDGANLLLIHPDALPANCAPRILVAAPALLALQALLRHTRGEPFAEIRGNDPMALPATPAAEQICGTLANGRLPNLAERRALAARLRLSWPTRRFRLPPRTPLWAWQLLHLLGLGAEGACFDLLTPPRWSASVYGRQLLTQILDNACLERLEESPRGLRLRFCKRPQQDTPVQAAYGDSFRSLSPTRLYQGRLSLLTLALAVPPEVWTMIEDDRLGLVDADHWPQSLEKGIFLFTRTSLGRYLWHTISGGRPLPRRSALRTEILRQGLPLPGARALDSLGRLQPDGDPDPGQSLLDRELGLWLGPHPPLPLPTRTVTEQPSDSSNEELPEQDLVADLDEQVFRDGVPLFPEHYLYDYYRPELRSYAFDGPLHICGEFFGTIELQDAQKRVLQVEGQETAEALEIISSMRAGPVKLPVEKEIITAILDRYRNDLRHLRSSLVKEVFRRQADPQNARSLVEKLWQQHALPPWRLVTGG